MDAILKRAFLFLESGNWDKADEYLERVLDQEPQNGEAYFGKLMIELQIRKQEDIYTVQEPFYDSDNYGLFIRFSELNDRINVEEYAENLRAHHERVCVEETYNKAVDIMNSARSFKGFIKAANLFDSIIQQKDSGALKTECLQKAEVLKKKRKKNVVRISIIVAMIVIIAALAMSYFKYVLPMVTYEKAESLMKSKKYTEAIDEYKKIPEYKDSGEKITLCQRYHKYYTIPDVVIDDSPGNIIENYGVSTIMNFDSPFVAEFEHNNSLYVIYDDKVGLHIVSQETKFNKTLKGYSYPNVYKGDLYCYKSDGQKIVSLDIKAILCDILFENEIATLKDLGLDRVDAIFVNKDKILIKDVWERRICMLIDFNGKIIHEYSDKGIASSILTSEETLAYISEEDSLVTINFFNNTKQEISLKGLKDDNDWLCAYSDGKYYFRGAFKNKTFNVKNMTMHEENKITTYAVYDKYWICSMLRDDYVSPTGSGFYALKDTDCINYVVDVKNNIKYRMPSRIGATIAYISFGKNDKMYICGYESYNDKWTIYRMNMDCTEIEIIGVYEK